MVASLQTALLNKETLSVEVAVPSSVRPRAGSMIEEIRQHRRSIDFVWDDGVVLHTVLWPLGRWRILHKADRWRLQEVNAVIDIGEVLAVCRGAATVELHRDFDPRRHPRSGPLGPDVSVPGADIGECVRRMRAYEERDVPVSEVLADTRVVQGVGNVARCEALWTSEMNPWAPIGVVTEAECAALVALIAELVAVMPVDPAALQVYGRQGKGCRRCGGMVKVQHHGEASRVAYWCPECQTGHAPYARADWTPVSLGSMPSLNDRHPAAQRFFGRVPWRRSA
jgi:endonuclease-8